jgi:glycosyltransferase involved in cell wall biosynthesis
MDIVAVLAMRNERAYLANALQHLIDNGIRYAILDNESDDGSTDILAEARFRQHLVHLETLPYPGHFDLFAQLEAKQRLYDSLDADWLMHLDVDEIVHSYRPGERLDDAISRIAATGADAINFNEFVFLPVEADYIPDHPGVQPMRHYYHFSQGVPQKINAWRAALRPDKVKSGGHKLHGVDYRLAEETLAMRHYMFTDQDHAYAKYTKRRFAEAELRRGWHAARANAGRAAYRFPPPARLKALADPADRALSRADPKPVHYWQWGPRAWIARKARGLLRRIRGRRGA